MTQDDIQRVLASHFGSAHKNFRPAIEELSYVFEKRAQELIREERDRIQKFLLKNGHGGGNWRRLIIQLTPHVAEGNR